MGKIIRRSCGIEKFQEHVNELEITDTINTGNIKKMFAADISLVKDFKKIDNRIFICILNLHIFIFLHLAKIFFLYRYPLPMRIWTRFFIK